jgi:CBS domain containing-hemolysin-like protein
MIGACLLLGAAAGVFLSGFVSAIETGSYVLNRVRLRVRSEQGDRSAQRLAGLMDRIEDVVITALLGNTLADYIATACVTLLLLHLAVSENLAELYATAILTPLILVVGGIVPKDWFQREADRLMYPLALPVEIGVRIARATGLVWLLRAVTQLLTRCVDPSHDADGDFLPRVHVQRLLHEGAARGGLSPVQRDIIDRVLNISHISVVQVMIPRPRAATVPIDISRGDFLRAARMAHFSRMPVWRGDPRQVVGIVNVYDVLIDQTERPIAEHVRPALYLRPAERVPAALLRLQQERAAMAIVRDGHGVCLGLLTVKDLVEEIVGELEVW